MRSDDRRIRILALAMITLVFVVFMGALLYWAVNVASKGIQSRVFVNVYDRNITLANTLTIKSIARLGSPELNSFQFS